MDESPKPRMMLISREIEIEPQNLDELKVVSIVAKPSNEPRKEEKSRGATSEVPPKDDQTCLLH
jgi:hypothetical protein